RTIARMVSVIQASYLLCRIGVLPRGTREGTAKCRVSRDYDGTKPLAPEPEDFSAYSLDLCSVAEYFSFMCQPVRRVISAGPFRQSGHTARPRRRRRHRP